LLHQSKGSVEVSFTIEEFEVAADAIQVEFIAVRAEQPLDIDEIL
jgi:hypothetical protein